MSLLSKIIKISKIKASETEKQVDKVYGVEIAAANLKEMKKNIATSIKELYELGASKKIREGKLEKLEKQIADYENKAIQCLKKENRALALEVSKKILKLKQESQIVSSELQNYEKAFDTLKRCIDRAKKEVSDYELKILELKRRKSANSLKEMKGLEGANEALASNSSYLEELLQMEELESKKKEVMNEYNGEDITLDEKLKKNNIIEDEASEAEKLLQKLEEKL